MYWKSALSIPYSPLMDCYFYTSANGEWQVAVYTLLFFFIVSINGLLLLHIYKRRMGCEPYMPYGFPSLSPLTDCYLYTSANEEWACNRVCLMVSFPCLHWWIATSTHLQMKNEHVTVYALWFSFIVSINGLIFLHFHRPIIQESVSGRMHAPTPAHKDLKGAVDKERNPAAFPRRYGQQDSDVTPAWEEPSGWNHMFVPPSCVSWQSPTLDDYKWQVVPFRPVLFFFYFVFRNNASCVI